MSAVYSLLYKHTLFTKAIDVLVLRVVEAVALANKVGLFFFLLEGGYYNEIHCS